MRTLAMLLAACALFAVGAGAQPQPDDSSGNTPPMPVAPPAAPAGGRPGGAPGTGPFHLIDPAIKDLQTESVDRFTSCVSALEYLRGDLTATQRRLKERNGGKIPSNQSGLIALKIKRVGRQQQLCIDETKQTNEHFNLVMRSLAGVEPSNHPGIPARRAKIGALREKFTAALKKLKAAGVNAPSPESGADGGEDSDR